MGWASGSSIMSVVIQAVSEEVHDKEVRKRIYSSVTRELLSQDWDTDVDVKINKLNRG